MDAKQILQKYGDRLYNLAARITGNRDEAYDVVQDTLITYLGKSTQFKGNSSLYTWLYRVTINRALQYKKIIPPEVLSQQLETMDFTDTTLPATIADWDSNPEKEFHLKELMADVKAECHHFLLFVLSPEQRITFLLRTITHLSYKEIGEVLDINENAVKARMDRIKKRISTDFHKRCSHHSPTGTCKCKATLKYVLQSYPQILNNISGNSDFIDEIEEAFKHADQIELLYEKLPYLQFEREKIKM